MDEDYYETLQIQRNATDAEIKRAYRRLALKYHPSCNRDEGSYEKFTELGEAYEVLSDTRKKATYDKFGLEGLKGGLPPEFSLGGAWCTKYAYHGIPERTFLHFFGGDNPFADFYTTDTPLRSGNLIPGVVKTKDFPIEREIFLTLEDLFHGCKRKIKISRRVMSTDGNTSTIRDKILTIDVMPGWKDGTKIIFAREGDQGPHCIPADMVFVIREKDHPSFIRRHNDLFYNVQVTLEKALTGFSVKIKTLDDRLLNIPINEIVHPNFIKVLKGEGMPLFNDRVNRGNLIITFEIKFPSKLTPDRRNLIKQALDRKK